METIPPIEVLWEITPNCNKNCKYCGSANIKNNEFLSFSQLTNIAENIATSISKPKEITLTGGEPGTLPFETIQHIISIFRDKHIKVKAVTNGKLIEIIENNNALLFDNFKRIGLSINTLADIQGIPTVVDDLDNITVITNFGTHNIFLYSEIEKIARKFGCWQIQLTEGIADLTLPPEGISYLWDLVKKTNAESPFAILADNARECHTCKAGIEGCSITYSGDVIPCLSARSWDHNPIQLFGNLLNISFNEAWERLNKEYASKTHDCCRTCIKYPVIKDNKYISIADDIRQSIKVSPPPLFVYGVVEPYTTPWLPADPNDPFNVMTVVMYAVSSSPLIASSYNNTIKK